MEFDEKASIFGRTLGGIFSMGGFAEERMHAKSMNILKKDFSPIDKGWKDFKVFRKVFSKDDVTRKYAKILHKQYLSKLSKNESYKFFEKNGKVGSILNNEYNFVPKISLSDRLLSIDANLRYSGRRYSKVIQFGTGALIKHYSPSGGFKPPKYFGTVSEKSGENWYKIVKYYSKAGLTIYDMLK